MSNKESLDKFFKMVADDISEVSKKVSDRVDGVREDVSGKGVGEPTLASVIKAVTDMASGRIAKDAYATFKTGVGADGTLTQDELDELLETTKDDEFGGSVSDSWFDEFLKGEMAKMPRVHRIGDEGIRVLKTETIVVDTAVLDLVGGISSWKLLDGNLHIEFLIGGVVLLDMSGVDLSSLEIEVIRDKVYVRYAFGRK